MCETEPIRTDRLVLSPLDAADATEMVTVLSDTNLYVFTGGEPPSLEKLQERYERQSTGSPRIGETWHNWILRLDGKAIGYVQATVEGRTADLGWVVGSSWQGSGYATEASRAMRNWLAEHGVTAFSAHVRPDHAASGAVATKLGLRPTGRLDEEGEMIWA